MNVPSLVLLLVAGGLVATGVNLLLQRSLSRIFIGLGLITHGVNVLILASGGAAGRPPLLGQEDPASMADPLPQAMMLTSIVLSLGTTAFGLALAYRSWRLSGHDEVVDDVEDRLVAQRTDAEAAGVHTDATTGAEDEDINYDSDDPGALVRDGEAGNATSAPDPWPGEGTPAPDGGPATDAPTPSAAPGDATRGSDAAARGAGRGFGPGGDA